MGTKSWWIVFPELSVMALLVLPTLVWEQHAFCVVETHVLVTHAPRYHDGLKGLGSLKPVGLRLLYCQH